ncbi:MAG: DUF2249 domain-containing protein [Marmoricola sp.]
MTDTELDVRTLRKPDKHPTIFATYNALDVGETFVLVNNHDPRHLRDEFEAAIPGCYGWEYLDRGPKVWRIQISRLGAAPPADAPWDTTAISGADDPAVSGSTSNLQLLEPEGSQEE